MGKGKFAKGGVPQLKSDVYRYFIADFSTASGYIKQALIQSEAIAKDPRAAD